MPDLLLDARVVECTARRRTYAVGRWRATIDLVKGRRWSWHCWTTAEPARHGHGSAPTLHLARRAAMARLHELAKEV